MRFMYTLWEVLYNFTRENLFEFKQANAIKALTTAVELFHSILFTRIYRRWRLCQNQSDAISTIFLSKF